MRRLSPVFLATLLGLVIVNHTALEPEWFLFRWLLVAAICFGVVGFGWTAYRRHGADARIALAVVCYAALGLFLSWVMVTQARTGLFEPGRTAMFGLAFVGFVAFVATSADGVAFLRRSGPYLAAFAVFLFAVFSHLPGLPVGSGLVAYAMQAGFLLGLTLFVLPRYVSREAFFWTVAGLSGIVMAASLPVYLVGEYSLFGAPIRLWGTTFAVPLVGAEVPFLQSFLVNPNDTGLLAFAGAVCAVAAGRRAHLDGSIPGATALAGGLAVVNVVALVLTHSRASWLAAALSLGIVAAVTWSGRERLPHAVVTAGALTALFLLAMFFSIVDVSDSGRFVLWGAGLRAIAADPALLGSGMVASDEVLAPFIDGRFSGYSAHNSYVVIFLRTGLLGGLAYLVVTVGSVVDAAVRRPGVDASMVALALGFAVHQLFESYTLLQFGVGSVVGALAVGYLVAGELDPLVESVKPARAETSSGGVEQL